MPLPEAMDRKLDRALFHSQLPGEVGVAEELQTRADGGFQPFEQAPIFGPASSRPLIVAEILQAHSDVTHSAFLSSSPVRRMITRGPLVV